MIYNRFCTNYTLKFEKTPLKHFSFFYGDEHDGEDDGGDDCD